MINSTCAVREATKIIASLVNCACYDTKKIIYHIFYSLIYFSNTSFSNFISIFRFSFFHFGLINLLLHICFHSFIKFCFFLFVVFSFSSVLLGGCSKSSKFEGVQAFIHIFAFRNSIIFSLHFHCFPPSSELVFNLNHQL